MGVILDGKECLGLIAYKLGNLWRRLVLPRSMDGWSLTNSQRRRVNTGTRLVRRAWHTRLVLAERHLPRRLCELTLSQTAAPPLPRKPR